MEPVWGGKVDTAAVLRGTSAIGLVQAASPLESVEVLNDLAKLLCDPEVPARTNAAIAVSNFGHEAGAPLLRLKILSGDPESGVLGKCFTALLTLSESDSIPFVAQFLKKDEDPLQLEAAAALAECKSDQACAELIDSFKQCQTVRGKRDLLTFLGVSGHPLAEEFLLTVVRGDDESEAQAALHAIAPRRFYERSLAKIRAAVEERKDRALAEIFTEKFCTDTP